MKNLSIRKVSNRRTVMNMAISEEYEKLKKTNLFKEATGKKLTRKQIERGFKKNFGKSARDKVHGYYTVIVANQVVGYFTTIPREDFGMEVIDTFYTKPSNRNKGVYRTAVELCLNTDSLNINGINLWLEDFSKHGKWLASIGINAYEHLTNPHEEVQSVVAIKK